MQVNLKDMEKVALVSKKPMREQFGSLRKPWVKKIMHLVLLDKVMYFRHASSDYTEGDTVLALTIA